MLAKTSDDRGSTRRVVQSEFDRRTSIPSVGSDRVRIIQGRVVVSTDHRLEHENLLQSLRSADRVALRSLFYTLSPPPMDSLVGEYDAELLNQGGPTSSLVIGRAFGMYGPWIGKAFCPLNANTGVGYNCFQSGGSVVRKLPMTTIIEQSTLDDRLSLKISYRANNRGVVRWLFGEVRQVTRGVMLGIGMFGPAIGRRIARRKIPFVLYGPCRSYKHLSDQSAAVQVIRHSSVAD